MEYRCSIEYLDLSGEGKLTLTDDELCCLTPFDQYALPFTEITSIDMENHQLTIQSESGILKASKLGSNLTPAYLELYEKYNNTVRKALFISKDPMMRTKGEYRFRDEGGSAYGQAVIELYDRCLCILPPNDAARRIPLCFVRTFDKSAYHHTLTLDTGEIYEFMRLGLDTDPFDKKLTECLYAIRQNAIDAVLKTDGSLSTMQSSRIADLMPQGVAAPLGKLHAIASSFPRALEEKIRNSRAKDMYQHFLEICDPMNILIGSKSNLAGDENLDVLWSVAPKPGNAGGMAALEMAVSDDTSAATYLYRFTGDWDAFAMRLNHAIEAIDFHREVIFIPEEELYQKQNALYKMAVKRTASLQFLRRCFAGRVIHASLDSWKKDLGNKFV